MTTIDRPRQDFQMRKVLMQQLNDMERFVAIVNGQDK